MSYTNISDTLSYLLQEKVRCQGKLWKVFMRYEKRAAAASRVDELIAYHEGFDILVSYGPFNKYWLGKKIAQVPLYCILIRPSGRKQGSGSATWTEEEYKKVSW